jgi:Ca2+-binding RTX toxin-like protein
MTVPFRPVIVEPLETRRLLSASLKDAASAEVTMDGELHVSGTRGDDLILVSLNYDNPDGLTHVHVKVNDAIVGDFLLDSLTASVARVDAHQGNDTVRFDEVNGLLPLRLIASGGQGNDTLVGGALDDEFDGGAGDDTLYGNDGNDRLSGGNGKDLLAGGFGDDVLDGDNGKDSLYGEFGLDTLLGGNGKDTVDGGDDNDLIDGGRGMDDLTGGVGSDTFASTEKSEEILDRADEDVYASLPKGKRKT